MAARRPKQTGQFDPYASQRHKRGRKSHLAAAINQQIHDKPGTKWILVVVIWVGIIFAVAMALLK